MPSIDELAADVRVAFFGRWEGVDQALKVPTPDPEELCQGCIQNIGSRVAGASVKTDEGEWVHYHGTCWLEAVDESAARDSVQEGLDGEEVDPW